MKTSFIRIRKGFIPLVLLLLCIGLSSSQGYGQCAVTGNCNYAYVTGVSVANIADAALTCPAGGYIKRGTTGAMMIGTTYNGTITYSTTSIWDQYLYVWVDWDHDLFATTQEVVLAQTTLPAGSAGSVAISVTPPVGAYTAGPVRMRIFISTGNGATACTSNWWGSFNDYDIQLSSGSPAPALTAAAGATVDNSFDITFTDDAAWRAAITNITVDGVSLLGGYSISAGKITLTPASSGPAGLLQTAAVGKSIVITATGYSNATVSQTIGAGTPTKLGLSTQPSGARITGSVLTNQPVVRIQDQYGNTTTSTATITTAVSGGTWTLGGTTAVAAVSGTCTYTDLTATAAAAVNNATLTFTSPGLTSVTSSTFFIVNYSCSPTCTAVSGSTNYTATANTEYCLQGGTWTGNFTFNAQANVKLCIGGTWTPSAGIVCNNTNNVLDNAGSITAPSIQLNTYAGVSIINTGYMYMNGTANATDLRASTSLINSGTFISNGFATIGGSVTNNTGAIIVDTSANDLIFGTTFPSATNNGTIRKNGGKIEIYGTNTTFTNNGVIWNHKNGDFNLTNTVAFTNNGTLTYQGTTQITGGPISNTGTWTNNYAGATAEVFKLANLVAFTNSGSFYNNKGNLTLYNGASFTNNEDATAVINNGDWIFTNTATVTNNGNLVISGSGGLKSPCNNAVFTNNGHFNIVNGDMDWDGNDNVFNNNGVLTLETAGKTITLGNLGYSTLNNNGRVVAPNMLVKLGILQNNCSVELSGDFTLNDTYGTKGVRGPSTASGYVGKFSVAGTSTWTAGSVFGQAGQSIDFCDASAPATTNGTGWDNINGHTETGTVTHCTATADGDANCDQVLPVNLLFFKAKCHDDAISLTWASASEINNDRYIIERSINALNFDYLGTIKGAGNSNTLLHYTFTDNLASTGVAYYRLSQIDYDGHTETFPLIAASCLQEQEGEFYILTNPIENQELQFKTSGISNENIHIQLIDEYGRTLQEKSIFIENDGIYQLSLSNTFASGIYFCLLTRTHHVLTEKFFIK